MSDASGAPAAAFERALLAAVALLRGLPRRRAALAEARRRLRAFTAAHAGVSADALVDQPPGSPHVDYDVLLGDPAGGTVAVSWRPDGGTPWSVLHADHWAANFVVSVNGVHVTVQQALQALRLAGHQNPDLLRDVVDEQLIAAALEQEPPSVSEAEVQRAADDFRAAHGLFGAEATRRWLSEVGVSEEEFGRFLHAAVGRGKLADRLVAARIEPYFESRRADFDVVQVARAESPSQSVAKALADAARAEGLLAAMQRLAAAGDGLRGAVETRYVQALPPAIAALAPGQVVGPTPEAGWFSVAQVLSRRPARLDHDTRDAVREHLFRAWLAERRQQATVQWHWM